MNTKIFENRSEAGKELAVKLLRFKGSDTVVLAIPRGGIEVAYEISQFLNAPLDVFITRKVGAPSDPEFGIGAIAEGDVFILNTKLIADLSIDSEQIDQIASREIGEMERRISIYRENEPLINVSGKTVLLIDDGLATGITAQAALLSLQNFRPEKLIFATPVCSQYSLQALGGLVEEIICLSEQADLVSVGSYYKEFDQVTDDKVISLLQRSKYG